MEPNFDNSFFNFIGREEDIIEEPTETDDNGEICKGCGARVFLDHCYDLICDKCGMKSNWSGTGSSQVSESTAVAIRAGGSYCSQQEYSQKQYKDLTTMLEKCTKKNPDIYIPKNILSAVARKYNLIQKTAGREFVKRGNIKREILAALITREAAASNNLQLRKKIISKFIGLKKNGFSSGEDELIMVCKRHNINLNDENDTGTLIKNHTDAFLEKLEIEDNALKTAIYELVEHSENRHIGMNNQISSKVAGAVFGLLQIHGYKISCAKIERACGNCKKNTFCKFWNIVKNNTNEFKKWLERSD